MKKNLIYAFRITHIGNLPQILQVGLVRKSSPLHDDHFISIGDEQVILRREKDIKGYRLADYIPFYLGPRSPMLYVIQHGFNGVARIEPESIVYCVIRIEDLMKSPIDCIFTDGHALSAQTKFYDKNQLPHINDLIHFEDVWQTQWNDEKDRDLKRRKEAELLLKDDLPIEFIRGYVVYNDHAKQQLIAFGIAADKIVVSADYYY